jgi:hypothetical protein
MLIHGQTSAAQAQRRFARGQSGLLHPKRATVPCIDIDAPSLAPQLAKDTVTATSVQRKRPTWDG